MEWDGDIHIAVCEGDSKDDTWERLLQWVTKDKRLRLVTYDLGMPKYGSIVNRDRFIVLAKVFNRALDQIDLKEADWVLFVPFDVDYAPDVVKRLAAHDKDMVSPLTWIGNVFYDTWAMAERGMPSLPWGNFSWEWAQTHLGNQLIEMDRLGGMVLMKADVLRAGCRYTEAEVDRGLSRCAREKGFRLWVDPTTHIYHPPFLQEERIYST